MAQVPKFSSPTSASERTADMLARRHGTGCVEERMAPPHCVSTDYCPSDERARCERAILSADTGTAPRST